MIEKTTERKVRNAAMKLANHFYIYCTYFYHDFSKKESLVLTRYMDNYSCISMPFLERETDNLQYKDVTLVGDIYRYFNEIDF